MDFTRNGGVDLDVTDDQLPIETVRNGVEGHEFPGELVKIISATRSRFSNMLPALEESKEGALNMLQALKPESNAFAPTQGLVDFSSNGIECVERFISQLTELREELDSALESNSRAYDSYWQTLATSEANQAKLSALVGSMKNVAEALHQSGDRLQRLLSTN